MPFSAPWPCQDDPAIPVSRLLLQASFNSSTNRDSSGKAAPLGRSRRGHIPWLLQELLQSPVAAGEHPRGSGAAHHPGVPADAASTHKPLQNSAFFSPRTFPVLQGGIPWTCSPCHTQKSEISARGTNGQDFFPLLASSCSQWKDPTNDATKMMLLKSGKAKRTKPGKTRQGSQQRGLVMGLGMSGCGEGHGHPLENMENNGNNCWSSACTEVWGGEQGPGQTTPLIGAFPRPQL